MTTSATPPAARRGPGRPADGGDRRQAILDAARQQFAEKGFAAASVRAIARQADVDPALVHHYFGSKEQVFVAAMELPVDPAERLPHVLAGDPDQLGERLVRLFLGVWGDPAFRTPMLGLVRSAITSEQGATMLREFVGSALLGRIVAAGDSPDPLRVSGGRSPAGRARPAPARGPARAAGLRRPTRRSSPSSPPPCSTTCAADQEAPP